MSNVPNNVVIVEDTPNQVIVNQDSPNQVVCKDWRSGGKYKKICPYAVHGDYGMGNQPQPRRKAISYYRRFCRYGSSW